MSETLTPKNRAEQVAHFRAQLLGPLLVGELARGELSAELSQLSKKRVLPPGARRSRSYSRATLERWYYAHRHGGIAALAPIARSDKGAARALCDAQRDLLLAIRQEHPSASAELILQTLYRDGPLPQGTVSSSSVRRLFAPHGLDRAALRRAGRAGRDRRRWEAAAPGVLWHADVCHGPSLTVGKQRVPMRIHAILDDASRTIIALEVCDNEREVEMLRLMVRAIRRHPRPEALYLDNGSTNSGETLRTACNRLDVRLLHAQPYDRQARGKMERFWRTLREGCLDHIGEVASLHDVRVRLWAFVEQHYHQAPHGGLLGKTPAEVWATHERHALTTSEQALEAALTVRERRRVRGDGTLHIGGVLWEAEQGFLAGQRVTVARALLETKSAPWVEHEEQRYTLRPVDPVRNGAGRRHGAKRPKSGIDVPFDPAGVLLDAAIGRKRGAKR